MTHPITRLVPALCFALVSTAAAQRAVVMGVVMDTAGRPLAAAEVLAMRAKATSQTTAGGVFRLTGLRKGKELFRVRRIGFVPQVFELDLVEGDTVRLGVNLARDTVQTLPEIAVNAPAPPTSIERFHQNLKDRVLRSGAPPSALITREELAKSNDSRLLPLLAVHGLKIKFEPKTGKEYLVCDRGNDRPAIWLDGAIADVGPTGGAKAWRAAALMQLVDLANFLPDQVEAVEIYKTPAERPPEYNMTGSYCTVAIWTRRSLRP